MNAETKMPASATVRDGVARLIHAGWQVRLNPILQGLRAVQLSTVYRAADTQWYAAVLTLRFNAPSNLVIAPARYDPKHPFDHAISWEDSMPVEEALDKAWALTMTPDTADLADATHPAHERPL
ncbi:hypothetical protein [Umezawaea sp. Da 62-37]|uniref:hypothetical protein n=1 Tax=Umezawaea sp. Da 62-37 TaxID=3075927 RepID=UPI0028F71A0E|nr:hypothetical protein [Umezawaea sp. Da 62-37]WNV83067.1 hypothetical protein RM788_33415 [Umezawaea sp. Da 62-37]